MKKVKKALKCQKWTFRITIALKNIFPKKINKFLGRKLWPVDWWQTHRTKSSSLQPIINSIQDIYYNNRYASTCKICSRILKRFQYTSYAPCLTLLVVLSLFVLCAFDVTPISTCSSCSAWRRYQTVVCDVTKEANRSRRARYWPINVSTGHIPLGVKMEQEKETLWTLLVNFTPGVVRGQWSLCAWTNAPKGHWKQLAEKGSEA